MSSGGDDSADDDEEEVIEDVAAHLKLLGYPDELAEGEMTALHDYAAQSATRIIKSMTERLERESQPHDICDSEVIGVENWDGDDYEGSSYIFPGLDLTDMVQFKNRLAIYIEDEGGWYVSARLRKELRSYEDGALAWRIATTAEKNLLMKIWGEYLELGGTVDAQAAGTAQTGDNGGEVKDTIMSEGPTAAVMRKRRVGGG